MLAYTCDAALQSRRITRVLLSTDSAEIAAVGRQCGLPVSRLRPPELSADDTPILPVLRHELQQLAGAGFRPDLVVLLQPTSPLRMARHVDEAIDLLLETGADTVVSVVRVPHRFSPDSVMVEDAGCLHPYRESSHKPAFRRQDKPKYVARNGPAVVVWRTAAIDAADGPYPGRVVGYEMGVMESVDVDDALELRLAELFLAEASRR